MSFLKPQYDNALVELYENKLQCNCNLDNWQPEQSTGHSWVCRIHNAVIEHDRQKYLNFLMRQNA
jgi:hypothetical protein